MKNRKPSINQQKEMIKVLLANEINTQKSFLDAAQKKVDELIGKIASGETSQQIENELTEQGEVVISIKNKLAEYKNRLDQLKA